MTKSSGNCGFGAVLNSILVSLLFGKHELPIKEVDRQAQFISNTEKSETYKIKFSLKSKINSNSNNSSKKGGPNTTITKFSCKLHLSKINDSDSAILCGLCQAWVHIKRSHLNYINFKYLEVSNEP